MLCELPDKLKEVIQSHYLTQRNVLGNYNAFSQEIKLIADCKSDKLLQSNQLHEAG